MKKIYFVCALLCAALYAHGEEEEVPLNPTSSEVPEEVIFHSIQKYLGTPVTTSPYPGVRASYQGSDLMTNLSSVNKDLQILIEKKSYDEFLRENKRPYPQSPRLFLSGQLETTAFVQRDGSKNTQSDLNLTGAEVDFVTFLQSWLSTFIAINYDDGPSIRSLDRVMNSRLKISTAFVMVGNLGTYPLYTSFGQEYVPFGQFTTFNPVSDPLTKPLFRVLGRPAVFGYYAHGFQVNVFAFKGASFIDSGNNLNNYGGNFSYKYEKDKFQISVAGSILRNIADSCGMQNAFGANSNNEKLIQPVGAIDIRTYLSYGPVILLFEYNDTLRRFNPSDMAFSTDNGQTFEGAKVRAFSIEGGYNFTVGQYTNALALSYSLSREALGFNLPKERWVLSSATNISRNSVLRFEYKIDRLYNARDAASGKIVPGNPYFMQQNQKGNYDHTFTIDYLVYW